MPHLNPGFGPNFQPTPQMNEEFGLAARMDPLSPARFTFDGQRYTLAEMLGANAHDPDCCDWIRSAEVGDVFNGCARVA